MIYIIIIILLLPVLTFIFHKREHKFTIIYFDLSIEEVYSLDKFAFIHNRTFIGNKEYKDVMLVRDGEWIIYLNSPCNNYEKCLEHQHGIH